MIERGAFKFYFVILQFCKVSVRKFDGNNWSVLYNRGNKDETRRKKTWKD